jgi:hypothetical protein
MTSSPSAPLPCVEPDCGLPRANSAFYCADHLAARPLRNESAQTRANAARDLILVLLLAGGVAVLLGGYLALSSYPAITTIDDGFVIREGSDKGFLGGLILLAFGCAIAMVGLVAMGVILGNRVTRDSLGDTPTRG